jgi:acetoin utilization deacetylase AcuC-like enzyme
MLKIAFDPQFIHPLPEGHRFPMEKYDLLPRQLLYEGTVTPDAFFEPGLLTVEHAQLVHDPIYLQRLMALELTPREQRVTGFPHSEALIQRELNIMEGTRACAEWAMKSGGVGMNIAGGTHHAFAERGEGFCLLNDQAIAAAWLLEQQLVEKILIIDLDVHQGNGTAAIFAHDERVFTFSMHGEHNYPLHKEHSTLDVGLPDGIQDKEYLYLLAENLDQVLTNFKPGFVFYQSGVDILASDKLGRLGISLAGCRQRDQLVMEAVRQLNVPLVCSMGGGYSADIKMIIEAHANTFRVAQNIFGL